MNGEEKRFSAHTAFMQMEREHGLFEARMDGWSLWRVMRNPLYQRLMDLPLARAGSSSLSRILAAIRVSFGLLWILLGVGQRPLLIMTCRSGLRMAQGNRFRDVYFDGLLQRGHSFLKLEEDNSPDFAHQARHALFPSGLDPIVFTFWGSILGTLFPAPALPFCVQTAQLLERECGLRVAPRWLLLRISTVMWQARLFKLLLRRVRPQVVLVSNTSEYALRLACLQCGIRFIELQHGVFNAAHPDAIPDWVEGDAGALLLPDILACRGAYWIEQLQSTRQGRDHAVAVGNELIDLARETRATRFPSTARQIVLTTQGLDTEKLVAWVQQMIATAPVDLEWILRIKLHPIYDSSTTAYDVFAQDPRVQVNTGAQLPNVFELLAQADLHLSIASACHFDAASLGVPSMVIPLSGHETMLSAVDGRAIVLASAPQDVWNPALAVRLDKAQSERYSNSGFLDKLERLILDPNPQQERL